LVAISPAKNFRMWHGFGSIMRGWCLGDGYRVDRASGHLYIDVAKHSLLREDILSEIVRLLEARYHFSERVYYHHAKIAAGALVARAVELALVHGFVREEDFYDATDESVLELLERSAAKGEREVAERVRSLVDRLRRRRLPSAWRFPRHENAAADFGRAPSLASDRGTRRRGSAHRGSRAFRNGTEGRDPGDVPRAEDAAQGGAHARALARRVQGAAVVGVRRARPATRGSRAQLSRPVEVLRLRRRRRSDSARARRRDRAG
jgi:hypothetical protein